jgi:integrase
MSIQVRCPVCSSWLTTKKGGGEICKCGKQVPRGENVYRIRQRVKQADGTVIHRAKVLGKTTRYKAELASNAARIEIRKGSNLDGGSHTMTWREVIEAYLRKLEIEGRSAKYQHNSRLYLERMGKHWGFNIPVDMITKDMFQEFRHALMQGKFADPENGKPRVSGKDSVDRHHAVAKAAWEYSVRNIASPFKEVKPFRQRNEVVRYLSSDQKANLLRSALSISSDLFVMIVVALTTGLRKDNILKLRRDQVDFAKRVITVVQKGGKEHRISCSDSLLQVLAVVPDNGTEFFWVGQGGTPYHVDWRRPWKKAKELAGIPKEFRFHDLRHDAGTSVLRETGNIKLAKDLLGHSDIRITERYAHVQDEQIRAVTGAIDPLRGLNIDLNSGPPPGKTRRSKLLKKD